jgi:hypothetical protein
MVKIGSFLLAAVVMTIGFLCVLFYLKTEFTVWSFIVGFVGFLLTMSPAWTMWTEFFRQMLTKDEKSE